MREIYYCSCHGRRPGDLRRIVERLDATVADIRYSALTAPDPSWGRTELREILGDRYVRCIALADRDGCESWGEGGNGRERLIDFTIGVDFLRQIRTPTILMCGCRDAPDCHRAVVARRLFAERGWVSHPLDWDAARPPSPYGYGNAAVLDRERPRTL